MTEFYRWDVDAGGAPILVAAAAIGSVGAGIEFFIFGLPLHLEFAKRLEWASSKPFPHRAGGLDDEALDRLRFLIFELSLPMPPVLYSGAFSEISDEGLFSGWKNSVEKYQGAA
jgi:hypothetical protein